MRDPFRASLQTSDKGARGEGKVRPYLSVIARTTQEICSQHRASICFIPESPAVSGGSGETDKEIDIVVRANWASGILDCSM
jgi:hypothetical protein